MCIRDRFHPVGDGSTALFYQKDMIKDDYKAMAKYILDFTEKYHMTFPGWVEQVSAGPVKDRHEVIADNLNAKLGQVADALLVDVYKRQRYSSILRRGLSSKSREFVQKVLEGMQHDKKGTLPVCVGSVLALFSYLR